MDKGDWIVVEESVHMGERVKIYPPCYITGESTIGDDVTIFSGCYIKDSDIASGVNIYAGNYLDGVKIGRDSTLFPNNYIKDSVLSDACEVTISHIVEAKVGGGVRIGPFARLRPGAVVEDECVVGDFVEIKNSILGQRSMASHLSYMGDCTIGSGCNIGCGAIFVNYDGKDKHHTIVGDDCFIGSNCNIIAPVEIKKGSYICAGTTITQDVEEDDFVIGRNRQEVKKSRAHMYWKNEKK